MPIRPGSDVTKDQITRWLYNALRCELWPDERSSLANEELPDIRHMTCRMALSALGDETHVIKLQMNDGNVFSLLVKLGDYAPSEEGV